MSEYLGAIESQVNAHLAREEAWQAKYEYDLSVFHRNWGNIDPEDAESLGDAASEFCDTLENYRAAEVDEMLPKGLEFATIIKALKMMMEAGSDAQELGED